MRIIASIEIVVMINALLIHQPGHPRRGRHHVKGFVPLMLIMPFSRPQYI